jgi:hypothetical protein
VNRRPHKESRKAGELTSLERFVRNMATDRRLLTGLGLIGLLVGVSLLVPLRKMTVALIDIQAQSVTLRFAEAMRARNLDVVLYKPGAPATVTAGGFDRIDLSGIGCGIANGVRLNGELSVDALNLDQETQLRLETDGPDLRLWISGSGSVIVSTTGPPKVSPADSPASPCDAQPGGGSVTFIAGPSTKAATIRLTWAEGLKPGFELKKVRVSEINFNQQTLASPRIRFDSTIEDGKVCIQCSNLETDKPVKLQKSDILSVTGLDGDIGNLSFTDGRLQLGLTGTARGVDIGRQVGPQTFRRDLRPSYFFYLISLNWLVTLCLGISAILAFAWKFRSWARETRGH